MAGGEEHPGSSVNGLAGEHYRAVRRSVDEVTVVIESIRLTRRYGEMSVEAAHKIGMSGLYLDASQNVHSLANDTVKALLLSRSRLEALSAALLDQGA